MRFDLLIDRLAATVARERALLRRVARYVLPLVLLPMGPAVAQIPTGWLGLFAGGLVAMMMLVQAELFIRPSYDRVRVIDRDITYYLGLDPPARSSARQNGALALLLPGAVALAAGGALFMPAMLAASGVWQRVLALALAAGALWILWRRLAEAADLMESVSRRLGEARAVFAPAVGAGGGATAQVRSGADAEHEAPARAPSARGRSGSYTPISEDGLLEPELARRAAGLPLPVLPLSPAGKALLRVEAYLTLRDFPHTDDQALIEGLAAMGREAYAAELRHGAMPPVGGKIYLPVAAGGTLARMLGASVRRLGMDGAYSGSLRTWLVRLPPARSYVVAGRLIDAVVALRILPPGAVVPHHLTVQGDLGGESRVLSALHLAATPLLFEERPGSGGADERPFIMRGGGVLDDLGGRGGRGAGARTDFIDGFLFVDTPGMDGVEHLTAHTLNLRLKQVLAYALQAELVPSYRRTPAEARAAESFGRLRARLQALLARHELADALEADWLEGSWSQIWPTIARMSQLKERDPAFLDDAQALRDEFLDEIESLAVAAVFDRR